jgi:septum formation topological specificity factor MinE
MSDLTQNAQPFKFYTRLHLSELTGLRASNLAQLLKLIKEVPGSCIYHHTHRFLQQHQYLSPEPPNDFAYWVNEVLGEASLGEKLVSIDTIQFSTIRGLREEIIKTIESYIKNNPLARLKFASEGEEFHFIKSVSFIVPTKYIAYNLSDFVEILKKITIDSIYFHIFEARLRLERTANDFSYWIETSIGDKTLASIIAHLDPYTYTLEDLRRAVVRVIEEYIRSKK